MKQMEWRGERLRLLSQTSPDSDMGKLLRTFWQPVALSRNLHAGTAQPLRMLGETFTLFRGAGGRAHVVGDRCAHRCTVLHTGWVEGDEIRCMYHGWKYDGDGRCTERPAERDTIPPAIHITGYPVHEYAGLIFAYFGPLPAPVFDLPRRAVCEGTDATILALVQVWPCNWYQSVENAMDGAHVSFVHQKGRVGAFGQAVTNAIPELEYVETDSGMRQIATRGPGNVRVSDWNFPNNNHIRVPGPLKTDPWIDACSWKVPIGDLSHARFSTWTIPHVDPDTDARLLAHLEARGHYNPADHHDELFVEDRYPDDPVFQLTTAQDYVAQVGQGAIVDREHEVLGRSDAGIALMRRIFFREMAALREGRPAKAWRRLAEDVELPIPVA